jgi:hypothetical protein
MLYRVYFNKIEEAPQIWSVDEGTTASEINVRGVDIRITQGAAITYQNLAAEPPEPKAWIEVEGLLTIANGFALIR